MSVFHQVGVLTGRKQIANYLGLDDPRAVARLACHGAPIRVTGTGTGRRYYADPSALRRWIRGRD